MGIEGSAVEEALSGYDEAAAATRLAEKKSRNMTGIPQTVLKRRLCGMLKRRGFSFDTVRKTLKEACV
jgi:SOS response regulatory protein OraA/RecX